jgi:hypothetical protein
MTGPVSHLPRNMAREVQEALDSRDGWKVLEQQLLPAIAADSFHPGDEVLIEIARYAETDTGAKVIAWLHSLSDRAPYPCVTGGNLEHAALGAAKHEGRASVGHVIEKAVREGKRLRDIKLKQQEQASHEDP